VLTKVNKFYIINSRIAIIIGYNSKLPHSKLWGITGKGATPLQVTDEAAFIPQQAEGYSAEIL